MNYQSQQINARMGLEEAVNTFSDEICYITLRDGTNIEIIPQNQPEMGYNDNQLNLQEEEFNDEFVEENFDENNNYDYDYEGLMLDSPTILRGKGQNINPKKSILRKTVLKSLDGREQEKKVETEVKLRNINEKILFSHIENNDYLQCANCLKFFLTEGKENLNENKSKPQTPNKPKIPQQPQQQKQNYPQNQQQQYPQNQQKVPNNQQQYPQQYPQNQQKYPQNQQKLPQNQQKFPANQQIGIPQRPNQPQQIRPGQKTPQKPNQQYYQQIPQQQKGVINPKQKNNILPGNMKPNRPPNLNQFGGGGQIPVFRARKKETNRYDSNNDYLNNNASAEENYYSSSGKPRRYGICDECSSHKKMTKGNSYGNINVAKNLQFGFNNSKKEMGYTDNNLSELMKDEDYYEYPNNYKRDNMIPSENRNYNNHRVVAIKRVRNQTQEYDYY